MHVMMHAESDIGTFLSQPTPFRNHRLSRRLQNGEPHCHRDALHRYSIKRIYPKDFGVNGMAARSVEIPTLHWRLHLVG